MYSLVLKIVHNTRIKDTIAIARGLYKVSQSYVMSPNIKPRTTSWMDDPKIHTNLKEQPKQDDIIIKSSNLQPFVSNHSRQPTQSQFITQVENNQVNEQKREQRCQLNKQKIQDINMFNQNLKTQNIKQQTQSKIQKKPKQNNLKMQKIKQREKQYLKQFKERQPNINLQLKQKEQKVSTIPSSRLGRIFEFSRLGLSLASASIFSNGKDQSYYQQAAQKITNQLCKMRGAPLKLAQMLSIQEENLIPAPIRKAFQRARQSAHVIPQQQVQFMLVKNLGDNWKQRFKQFEMNPVASASIGQVHKAILPNSQQIAVKIQYKQVKDSINSDIQNLGLLLRVPGVFPKGLYVQRLLKNTKEQLMQQCDYLLEKFYQQKYDYYLKKSLGKQAQLYKVPKIYPQFTTSQILTSQFLSGIKMKQLQQEGYSQQLRDQIGRRIMKLTFKQLFQMGIMQSDPNPANYTYNYKKDQLNLFDFGATHIYNKQFLQNYYKIIDGSIKKDELQIWQASIKTGFVTGQQNMVMKNGHIQSILIIGQPLRHQGYYDFGSQQITNRIYKTIPVMLKNRVRPPPQEVYSLHRKLSGSYLACIRLKAKVDCSAIFKQISFQTMASHQQYEPIKQEGSDKIQQ